MEMVQEESNMTCTGHYFLIFSSLFRHFMVCFNLPTEWTALEFCVCVCVCVCRSRDFTERTQELRIDLSVVK
jgi:hypothetical protein